MTKSVEAWILELLPKSGEPITNQIMKANIIRRSASPLSPDAYFKARDTLHARGAIGRMRGPGGLIFLIDETLDADQTTTAQDVTPAIISERSLMPALVEGIETTFLPWLDLPPNSTPITMDVSERKLQGRWANPDAILLTVSPLKVFGGRHIDLHSFELKTETGCNVLAVHEALAQSRFSHYAHLVWHLPAGSEQENTLDQISEHCTLHGVGLLRFEHINGAPNLTTIIRAKRTDTSLQKVDDFLEMRLTAAQISRIKNT